MGVADLAKRLTDRRVAWVIVGVSLLVAGAGTVGTLRVDRDDDLLAFLPGDNPGVAAFRKINETFGGLEVAIVGVETDDPFDPAFFEKLSRVTKRLGESSEVGTVISLANVEDFRPSEMGGIERDLLVREMPKDPKARQAIIERVMSRDLVVSNLIAENKKAVILYAFATFGTDPKTFASKVHEIVVADLGDEKTYWGGAPFVSTYIYSATQADLKKLTPWAVIVIVLLIIVSFRDAVGAGLALVSTGMGIVVSTGLMGFLGVRYNIVLSSMPVILFAVGSAYAIHVLAHYYQHESSPEDAIVETLSSIGPIVLAAGLTTVAGLLSFLAMDIEPLQTFGVFTALGIFSTLVLSLTFVPAVIVLLRLKPKKIAQGGWYRLIQQVTTQATSRRWAFGLGLALVAGAGAWFAGRVDTRMDQAAFFAKGSPPDQADRFLREHFGGAMFVQVHLRGDFGDPHALRELQRIADEILVMEHVSSVQHAAQVIAQVNNAMTGVRGVPLEREQVGALYGLLTGNAALPQLVTEDKKQALIHVKLGTSDTDEVDGVLVKVEALVKSRLVSRFDVVDVAPEKVEPGGRKLACASARLRAITHTTLKSAPSAEVVQSALTRPVGAPDAARIKKSLTDYLVGDEAIVPLQPDVASKLAEAVYALGPKPTEAQITGVVKQLVVTPEGEEDVTEDVAFSIEGPLAAAYASERARLRTAAFIDAAKLQVPAGPDGQRLIARLRAATQVLDAPTVMAPSDGGKQTLEGSVSGLPVLYRSLSESVRSNQSRSLFFALGLVVIILSALFRSITAGLLASAPTLFTLLVVYGGMGVMGIHLDIGTSMLASMIIGAGVDYAVHLVAAWESVGSEKGLAARIDAARRAARLTGPAIWTNAIMVAAGFFVLTLGEAKTLQNVGGLICVAMLTAACATFAIVGVLARRRRYPTVGRA